MGIIRPWPALRKRRCIRQVNVLVPIDEEIISAWEQLLKGDEGQGRPVVRCPSVPLDYLYICSSNYRTLVLNIASPCCTRSHGSWSSHILFSHVKGIRPLFASPSSLS